MQTVIDGFVCDFVEKQGLFMVLSREGLKRSDLSPLDVRMLGANEVPGILKLEIEEIDLSVRFRYDISARRMLSQRLRSEPLTQTDYYRFLLQTVNILEDGRRHMLDENSFLIHEDFAFVGRDWSDVRFPYIPMRLSPVYKKQTFQQLNDLAVRLIGCIDTITGNGVQSIMACLRQDGATLTDLKRLLVELLAGNAVSPPSSPPRNGAFSAQMAIPQRNVAQQAALERNDERTFEPTLPEERPPDADGSERKAVSRNEARIVPVRDVSDWMTPPDGWTGQLSDDITEDRPFAAKKSLYVAAAAAALILLIWSFYPEHPGAGAVYVFTGLSLFVADAAFVLVRFRLLPGFRQNAADAEEDNEDRFADGESFSSGTTGAFEPIADVASPSFPLPGAVTFSRTPAAPQPGTVGEAARVRPAERTALLASPDATVWLNGNSQYAGRGQPRKWLEVKGEHGEGKIELNERLVIGRTSPASDYAIPSPGVSKVHAEIFSEQGRYWVKDLGSRNGTLMNGKPLVPYKAYPFETDDELTIVGTRFVLKTE
jgi:hypothetical protein